MVSNSRAPPSKLRPSPLPRSFFQKQGKTAVLPVLPTMVPLKLILNVQKKHLDSLRISLESVTGQILIFATSFKKLVLTLNIFFLPG